MSLRGKVAIVTGGGRGIGRAISLAFSEEGAEMVVADKDDVPVKQVVEKIGVYGRRALGMQVNVTGEAQVNAMVERTLDELGSIDVLVNCAGVFTYGSVIDLDIKDWDLTFNVNLKGTLLCCRAVLPHMISRKSGVIINFSSSAVEGRGAFQSAYVASKLGVEGLTKAMAAELKALNIRVNAIRPGAVDTNMGRYAYLLKHGREPTEEELSRWIKPRDIADTALLLASDDSKIITGQVINCYGF